MQIMLVKGNGDLSRLPQTRQVLLNGIEEKEKYRAEFKPGHKLWGRSEIVNAARECQEGCRRPSLIDLR